MITGAPGREPSVSQAAETVRDIQQRDQRQREDGNTTSKKMSRPDTRHGRFTLLQQGIE